MLIIGAKGFAKEVLELMHLRNELDNLTFFDNVSDDLPEKLYGKFNILRNWEETKLFFEKTNCFDFNIAVGGPKNRIKLFELTSNCGGVFRSVIAPNASIGNYDVSLGKGSNIMQNVFISNSVSIGTGTIINVNSTIGHDVRIGDFAEISPGVNISGNCEIGNGTLIGTNVTIIPKVKIGENVVIGAGSMVKDNIPDNAIAIGFPARVMKINNE